MTTPPDESPGGLRAWKLVHAAVLVLYLLFAYTYVWAQQPRYGPDEPRHFHYIRRLVEKRQLPVLTAGIEEDGAHTLHPPLYYFLMSPVYLAASGMGEIAAYRALKAVSPLLLLAALLLFHAALRRIFPDSPFARAAALAFVGLLPLFQLEACIVNNDTLAVLLGAALLWLIARTWDEPPGAKSALLAGLLMAAFVNTKATGWTLAPLWGLALLCRAVRSPGGRAHFIRDLALAYGVLLLFGTWWYVRNYQLYGQPVPLDFGAGDRYRPFNLRTGQPMMPAEVYATGYVLNYGWRAAEGLFQSFWSQVDWINARHRPLVYGTGLALVILALTGGFRRAAGFRRTLDLPPAGEDRRREVLRAWGRWAAAPLLVAELAAHLVRGDVSPHGVLPGRPLPDAVRIRSGGSAGRGLAGSRPAAGAASFHRVPDPGDDAAEPPLPGRAGHLPESPACPLNPLCPKHRCRGSGSSRWRSPR
jgi:hypothetical protein